MRSLWPREHGAYGQLGAPLLVALLLQRPTLPALYLAFAACLVFAMNEPLLVVLGHRGERVRVALGDRAARRLAIFGVGAGGFTIAGLLAASLTTLAIAGLVAIPAACVIAFAYWRREHSLAGELVAAVALPGAAAPVAVASGVAWTEALAIWGAWSLAYACSVVAVHRVIARNRRPAASIDRAVVLALVAIVGGDVALAIALAKPIVLVALPLAVVALALAVRPPRAKYLRAVGVALVIASVASGAIALAQH